MCVAASCDSPPPAQTPPLQPDRPGVHFAAESLHVGDRVGTLVADSVEATQTPADSSFVGVARFAGEITLTGSTVRHFDADLKDSASCFEADAPSAARLPRWRGDTRRPWFCFENQSAALSAIGQPGNEVPLTVVIDRFTINRGLSDQINTARLIRVVR